jgi:deoxyguanosine kinase
VLASQADKTVSQHYIVVEGPIGCGKTTLARQLAAHLSGQMMLEDPGANPFLARFYADMRRFALPTQLFFLFQRIEQLRDLKQQDLFGKRVIADFMLAKDPIFAKLTLDDAEYALYLQTYQHLKPQAPRPDLVISLQAPVDVLKQRVIRRNRGMERGLSEDYLAKLSDAYTRFFYDYDETPLLVVNTEKLNFADNPNHFKLLVDRIREMRGGREYFGLG